LAEVPAGERAVVEALRSMRAYADQQRTEIDAAA
jgi:hypothetical protein